MYLGTSPHRTDARQRHRPMAASDAICGQAALLWMQD